MYCGMGLPFAGKNVWLWRNKGETQSTETNQKREALILKASRNIKKSG